ncbi:MAG: phage major capsid protein, partial [Cetobacterium sp.]
MNMKKKLLKLLNQKEEARKALIAKGEKSEDITELRGINSQVEALNTEITELRSLVDSLDDEGNGEEGQGEVTEARGKAPVGGLNPIASYGLGASTKRSDADKELEYREAFMKHVLSGAEIPAELRAGVTTKTTDIGAIIPNTVMNKIVEKLRSYGNIFSRVTLTNVKGGITIPKSSLKPVASWTAEGTVANTQKKPVEVGVTFAYHKLQCRVAVSLEADTTSLAIFESTIIDNVYEAMIVALEDAIINGTGIKQPLGITKDTGITSTQKIAVKASEVGSWNKWSKILAKVPLSKRAGVVLILNNETFEGDIQGMVDVNGQPVARVTYGIDGSESYRFKGKEVVVVETSLPTFEAA